MGTRSLTIVQDGRGRKNELIVMYRQMDGYPTGHGQELADFLAPFMIVNGLGAKSERKIANGMGCLAAQIVAHFKTEPGEFYLYPSGTRDCGEEWIYTVYEKNKALHIRVEAGDTTYFGLPGTKQESMPCLFDRPVSEFNAKAIEDIRNGIEVPND